jgi:selenocysteine-specific elongation factor
VTEEGWLDLVQADLRETLAGTCLAEAPIIPVSARTGSGLDTLKHALAVTLAGVPPRQDKGQPRLPIDRVFSISGFGTVVTGTLTDGQFRVGDEVEIVPGGLRARVRGLQTHKKAAEVGLPGSRLAINLTGVHTDQLQRGQVVTRPGSLRPTTLVDVQMRLVPSGLPLGGDVAPPLRHNQAVDFYSGAAEVPARTRLLDAEQIIAGGSGWVQLRLAESVALAPGDRFIIRQASPSRTLGGGQVVNPHPSRRWRRFQPEVIAQLETLARGTPEDLLLHAFSGSGPITLKAAVEKAGIDAATAESALSVMIENGQIVPFGAVVPPLTTNNTPTLSVGGWHALAARMELALNDFHTQYPLRGGMAREELKSRVQGRDRWPARLFNEMLARAATDQVLVEAGGELLTRPDFRATFSPSQQTRVDALLAAFRRQPYAPPSMAESVAQTDTEIISALMYQGTLIRLSDDVLLLGETYNEMLGRIVDHIKQTGSITVALVRDMFNTSRKYALALMEHMDERKVTRRVGDERVLR